MIRKKLKHDAVIVHYSFYDLIQYNNKSLKISFQTEKFKDISFLLKIGTSLVELASTLPVEYVKVLWESLLNMGALIEDLENLSENSNYEKQLLYLESLAPTPILLQKTLSTKCVAILGVGRVGSVIVDQLIRLGIQNYILIDDDAVQIHHLNKQHMYSLKDVGFSKVDIYFSKIKDFHPHGQVSIFKKRINNQEDLSKIFENSRPDLIINAADEPHNLNQDVIKACIEFQVPFIKGSIGTNFGRIGPFIDQPTDMLYFLEKSEHKQIPEYIKIIKPFLGSQRPSNCIISTLVAYDTVRFLLNKQPSSYKKVLHVDFSDLPCKSTGILNIESNF